jgi:hypothetical protein
MEIKTRDNTTTPLEGSRKAARDKAYEYASKAYHDMEIAIMWGAISPRRGYDITCTTVNHFVKASEEFRKAGEYDNAIKCLQVALKDARYRNEQMYKMLKQDGGVICAWVTNLVRGIEKLVEGPSIKDLQKMIEDMKSMNEDDSRKVSSPAA